MGKIVYSHRIVSVLQQLVVDLGLTVTLSDEQADMDLASNQIAFKESADLLGISLTQHVEAGRPVYVFKRR